ncbi:hypothetical protein CDAR_86951 [Caerostris darwini]|uniref:Uncharacterized protein n=1 Tax=Caerostris darwini TaxID=1538125 RepID=A0AAV4U803_9ARAC|nr:hypothetical protein CDAR_86951 [Caerostris darwini]
MVKSSVHVKLTFYTASVCISSLQAGIPRHIVITLLEIPQFIASKPPSNDFFPLQSDWTSSHSCPIGSSLFPSWYFVLSTSFVGALICFHFSTLFLSICGIS